MEIVTDINFELDMSDLFHEMEDDIRSAVSDIVGDNEMGFITGDEFYDLVIDEDQIQELIDESNQDLTKLESMVEGIRTDNAFITNELEIARRSITMLLEERERTLGQRAKRAYRVVSEKAKALSRKVHWHMPRR